MISTTNYPKEWNGSWSDGSKEWTPEALKELDFTFGNEGIFWMPYESFLERFVEIWRARLFTPDWNVSQHWTTIQVPWSGDYNDTEFEFTIPEATTTVIVLSQLDGRYFGGLTGQYKFQLAFRLHEDGESEKYIVRGYSSGERSAVAEVELEAGTYRVLLQIEAFRQSWRPKIEEVVKTNWLDRRDKLIRIGLSYDLAHAKGKVEEPKKVEPKIEEPKKEEVNKVDEKKIEDKPKEPVAEGSKEVGTSTTEEAAVHTDGTHEAHEGLGAEPNPPPPPTVVPHDEDDDEDTEGDNAPWNAPLVVSLRVFCHKTAATIKVLRKDAEEETVETKAELDVDDPEKQDASKVVVKEAATPEAVVKSGPVVESKEKELTLQPKEV